MVKNRRLYIIALLILLACASIKAYIILSEMYHTKLGQTPIVKNDNDSLNVPTMINKIDDTYYIVDGYNNNILYSKELDVGLSSWNKIPGDFAHPHCFIGNGTFFIVVDTENNRLVTYKKQKDSFIQLETIDNVGYRPHYALYNNNHYYIWNGINQMLVYTEKDCSLILERAYIIPELENCYVRSFTVEDNEWYFPTCSGKIVATDSSFNYTREYTVPDDIAGLSYIYKRDEYWYVNVFTNIEYDTHYTDLVKCKDLSLLEKGDYESLYEELGLKSSPYYVNTFDGSYYMAALSGYNAIYRIDIINGKLKCVQIF